MLISSFERGPFKAQSSIITYNDCTRRVLHHPTRGAAERSAREARSGTRCRPSLPPRLQVEESNEQGIERRALLPKRHLVALWFATLGLTWQKGGDQTKKDTLQTALVEDLHLRGWDVDYTNHVAYKVSRRGTNATPVMFTMYCCMI